MLPAAETQALSPTLKIWQAYNPEVKAELFSTGVRLDDRLYLVDPIPLAPDASERLTADASVCGIFVTNANHARAAGAWAETTGAVVLASAVAASMLLELQVVAVAAGDTVGDSIEVVPIEGAVEGEIALYLENDGGAMVMGDALINWEPYGFALLPPKYCSDPKLMRRSLRQLLDFSFERLLFAHGMPIVSSARAKMEALLGDS